MLLQNAFLDTSVFYLHHVFSNGSHERAWLKKDVHAVQVITVLEVADAELVLVVAGSSPTPSSAMLLKKG